MTELLRELEAVAGLAEKATPGPWRQHPLAKGAVHQPDFECWIPQGEEDAALIAALHHIYHAHHAEIAEAVKYKERMLAATTPATPKVMEVPELVRYAIERCLRSQETLVANIDKENPDDTYASLLVADDIEYIRAWLEGAP